CNYNFLYFYYTQTTIILSDDIVIHMYLSFSKLNLDKFYMTKNDLLVQNEIKFNLILNKKDKKKKKKEKRKRRGNYAKIKIIFHFF
ncbi:hypothetical protein ACMBCN_00960, partial [Candidatus Liberibacter asiaticus]|nr:hypothetical protein [Candidatus Liberibacter asiaticus]